MMQGIKNNLFLCVLIGFVLAEISAPTINAQDIMLYGYFSTRFEKTFSEPSLDAGTIVKETAPAEWSYPFVNVMMQGSLNDNFRVFLNFDGSGAGNLSVKNFWGEYSASQSFKVRAGKIYRKFGLYNELLDAVPTYYGIEPPEVFDQDHLMISRTTTLMILGTFNVGTGNLNYSLSTDNGEGGPILKTFPLGFDLNYAFDFDRYKFGVSGYLSGGDAAPDVSLGSGSPRGGVLPWMANDKFNVIGGYFEGNIGRLTLQTEYIVSSHKAERDPGSVVQVVNNAGLFNTQLKRFLSNPDSVSESFVITDVKYKVQTWYVRAGYSFETEIGEVAPYVQWDWFSNPETIKSKKWGGDNEAGASDNGKFNKSTVGILYRPIPSVAVKLDQSFHFYKLNGENVNYPEIRLDFAYTFGL